MMACRLDPLQLPGSQGVIGSILHGICICLPQRAESESCLEYETNSNWGQWEAADA
jgi:hypothetical protein